MYTPIVHRYSHLMHHSCISLFGLQFNQEVAPSRRQRVSLELTISVKLLFSLIKFFSKFNVTGMKTLALKRPPTILYALERLKDFVNQPYKFGFITYNRPGLPKLMRSERRENVQKVLLVLIKHIDLITGRIVRPLGHYQQTEVYADCSLAWLAKNAGISRRTLCRVIVDLESVGWLRRAPQEIKRSDEWGTLAVATVVRKLTKKFFVVLGLQQRLEQDQEYLKGTRRARIMKTLIRIVTTKAKEAISKMAQKQCRITFQAEQDEKADLSAWMARSLEDAHKEWQKKLGMTKR